MMHTEFQRNCNVCGRFKLQLGGGIRVVNNFRHWVCLGCKKTIDKQKGLV